MIWFKGKTTDLETRYPGLGTTHAYSNNTGWATVFVYTNRISDWAEGVSDTRLGKHLETTVAEIRLHEARGAYKDLSIQPVRDIRVAGQTFHYVETSYLYGTDSVASALLLTVRNGQLLKYRITLYRKFDLQLEDVSRGFVEMSLKTDPTLPAKP